MKDLSAHSLKVHFEGRVYSVAGRFDTSLLGRGVNTSFIYKT